MSITLATINFLRSDRTRNLLMSVPKEIKKVLIIDNNKELDQKLYDESWDFNLEVIKVPFNTPEQVCKLKIVENINTKYFVLVDNDMVLPNNVLDLYTIIKSDYKIGGVSGILLDHGYKPCCGAHDIFIEDGYLIRDIREKIPNKIRRINNLVFIKFDFIPHAAIFRKKIFEDYTYDPKMYFEHIDFFLGHWYLKKWIFGICPHVIFQHYPGWEIDKEMYATFRRNKNVFREGYKNLLKKWKLKGVIWRKLYFCPDEILVNPILSRIKKNLPKFVASWIDYKILDFAYYKK